MSSRQVASRPSYVYFIQAQEGGPVKIGWTYNPVRRLKDLQSASPYKLVIRKLVPGTQRLEHYLHQRYESHRLEGEWFEAQLDMPGCLHVDGLSTANWLDDDTKVRVFEREAQEQREAARAYRQRQKQQANKRVWRNRAFEQATKTLLD
jgi:hypothetical protein